MNVFASGYANRYDTLYQNKDYAGECDFLESLFARQGVAGKSLLDLGCGTGGHAMLLAQRGYHVTAVERSADMLRAARAKAEQAGVAVDFQQGDITRLEWHETFAAAFAMFAVAGYLTEDWELEDFLAGAWRGLRPGGILVFDGWHGPGVLRERPAPRLLEIPLGNEEALLRLAEPRLDVLEQTVEIHYMLWHRRGTAITAESEEHHKMRFFFPRELRILLHGAGFSSVSIHPFREIDQPLKEHHWHFTTVAVKGK